MKNPMTLEGHNIIVTGAAQGIGEAVSRLVVELGGKAIMVDMQADKLDALAGEIGNVETYVGSVAEPGFVQDMVGQAITSNGAIHGLVNNAGIVRAAMINKMVVETWQQVIDVNLSGVFYYLQAVGRHMYDRTKDGDTAPASIVNISSDAGRRGTIGQINYGAAKSGVMGITMSAAREYAAKGIRVNSVCFGVVETKMTETIGPRGSITTCLLPAFPGGKLHHGTTFVGQRRLHHRCLARRNKHERLQGYHFRG